MWYDLGEKLIRDRVLADTHLYALELACQAWFRLLTLLEDLSAGGSTQLVPKMNAKGECVGETEKARPQVAMMKEAEASFKNWCTRFGLDPSSMSRVQTLPDEGKKGGKGKDPALALMEELGMGPEEGVM